MLHESADGEWSFTETLRRLAFATDPAPRLGVMMPSAPSPDRRSPEPEPLGAGSLMWDIAGEYWSLLIVPSALLLQVVHPMIGAAVELRPGAAQ